MRRNRKAISTFNILNNTFLVLICIVFIYPFLYTIAMSFSSPKAILDGRVYLVPVGFNIGAYQALFQDNSMITSLLFTAKLTILGVIASMSVTVITAYPLSKKDFKGRNIFLNLIIFTMYFNGGMIPTYLLVRNLGLLNSMSSLIFPGLIDTFFLIIMINYFRGLPVELEEAAKMEGANNFQIFLKVIIPLSGPVIATLVIFYAVAYWNTFFDALIYINSPEKYPLQIKLYQVLSEMNSYTNNQAETYSSKIIPENIKAATVLIATVPILVVYPFLQKYFVKGATMGAIKG